MTDAARPVPVILDTDMGNDIDDALALAMLHAFESRGEARLLAVTVSKDHPRAAPYVDVLNTFYGRPHVPVGMVRGGHAPHDADMIVVPTERRRADGSFVYPHALLDGADAPEATAVLRRALAGADDGAVVVVQIGFSTNLARLLASPADDASPLDGRALVARKVRLLSVMAGDFRPANGNFPGDTRPEYNVETDVPAAQAVFGGWPSEVVASGFEVGISMLFPAHAVTQQMSYVPDHPVAEGYRLYLPMPYHRPTWDLTSVLYAVRPDDGYFGRSVPGTIRVRDDGTTWLDPHRDGRHRFLTVCDAQRARALEAIVGLATQPPFR